MYNYFIGDLDKKDVDHFTTDAGLKIRRDIDKPFKKACNVFTKANIINLAEDNNLSNDEYFKQLSTDRIPLENYPLSKAKNNIVVERYPKLNKNEPYIFLGNHSCPEDIETLLNIIDRNAYLVLGSIDSLRYNPEMYLSFLNGMIPFDIMDKKQRKELLAKIERVLKTNSVLIYAEGSHNYSPNKIINDLYDGPVNAALATNRKIVLPILFRDNEHNVTYIDVSNPIDVSKIKVDMNRDFATEVDRNKYRIQQMSLYLRDQMATAIYYMMLRHTDQIHRGDYDDIGEYFINQYLQDAFSKLKWNKDVFDAEYLVKKTAAQKEFEEVNKALTNPEVLKKSYFNLRESALLLRNTEKYNVENNMREYYLKNVVPQQQLKLTRKR